MFRKALFFLPNKVFWSWIRILGGREDYHCTQIVPRLKWVATYFHSIYMPEWSTKGLIYLYFSIFTSVLFHIYVQALHVFSFFQDFSPILRVHDSSVMFNTSPFDSILHDLFNPWTDTAECLSHISLLCIFIFQYNLVFHQSISVSTLFSNTLNRFLSLCFRDKLQFIKKWQVKTYCSIILYMFWISSFMQFALVVSFIIFSFVKF